MKLTFSYECPIPSVIKGSNDVVSILRSIMSEDEIQIFESMVCIYLNQAHGVLGWKKVSQGGVSQTVIDNRLVLAPAILSAASAIILCHNHPSGNLNPSANDKKVTTRLSEACDLFNVRLLDHIILTKDSHYSMADNCDF